MSFILVLGATGKVGSEVINALIGKKQKVIAGLHDPLKLEHFKQLPDVHTMLIDHENLIYNNVALAQADQLFLVLPAASEEQELRWGKQWIDQAKTNDIKHITYLSSMGAQLKPITSHFQLESYLKASGISHTILRPNYFMQNFITYHLADIQQGKIKLLCGEGKVSFIDTRDIAAVAAKTHTNPEAHNQQCYTLTGSEALTHYDVAKIISGATGQEVVYEPLTEKEVRQQFLNINSSIARLERYLLIYKRAAQNAYADIYPDVQQILHREPITFKQFSKDYASKF